MVSATNEIVLYITVKYGNEERAILILPMQPVRKIYVDDGNMYNLAYTSGLALVIRPKMAEGQSCVYNSIFV